LVVLVLVLMIFWFSLLVSLLLHCPLYWLLRLFLYCSCTILVLFWLLFSFFQLRQVRAREQRNDRELQKGKDREEELMVQLEKVSKENAQMEIKLHSLNQRVRQLNTQLNRHNTDKDTRQEQERSTRTLERELRQCTVDNATLAARVEALNVELNHVQQENSRLATLATGSSSSADHQTNIDQYQKLLDQERSMKKELERKVQALEDERQQLAQDMQGAAQHLR
jgi:chromosome segregation ATPase